MKIKKYKRMSNNRYKLTLEDESNVILYEDVILKYNLLIKKNITDEDQKNIELDNSFWDLYYFGLKSLSSRSKSCFELRKLLLRRYENSSIVDKVIDKLVVQGYLNDSLFCKSFINNQILTTNNGPYKIKMDLLNKGVDQIIIDQNLDIYNNDIQYEKVYKIVTKMLKSNKNKGGKLLKVKIFNSLKISGFDSSIINNVMSKFDFFMNDKSIYEKEYNKLYTKLSRKYSSYELERKIKEKLYLKGLYKK